MSSSKWNFSSTWTPHNQNAGCMFLLQPLCGGGPGQSSNDGYLIWVEPGVWKQLFRFTHFVNVAGWTLTLLSGQLWSWTQKRRRWKNVETERHGEKRWLVKMIQVHKTFWEKSYISWYMIMNVITGALVSQTSTFLKFSECLNVMAEFKRPLRCIVIWYWISFHWFPI